jgi:hypothetical protein
MRLTDKILQDWNTAHLNHSTGAVLGTQMRLR